jgi:RNA polymerase sigma factor (TIGR02999 family)
VTVDERQATHLLQAWTRGDRAALDRLAPLVYAELRKLARFHMSHEAPNHTLQSTALIHEAFLRLAEFKRVEWKSQKHFYAAASQIMRRILVDYARKKRSVKRGRELKRVPWQEAIAVSAGETAPIDILSFDEALSRLEGHDARKARVLEAWFFSGMTAEEIAEALDIGTSTVQRDLEFAKVWLLRELRSIENHGE